MGDFYAEFLFCGTEAAVGREGGERDRTTNTGEGWVKRGNEII